MATKIFLSYMREDEGIVRQLNTLLLQRGLECWMDQENLVGGEAWARSIEENIRDSDHFIPILSNSFRNRQNSYFLREIEIAGSESRNRQDGKLYIIPVLLPDAEIPEIKLSPLMKLADLNIVFWCGDVFPTVDRLIVAIDADAGRQLRNDPAIAKMRYGKVGGTAHSTYMVSGDCSFRWKILFDTSGLRASIIVRREKRNKSWFSSGNVVDMMSGEGAVFHKADSVTIQFLTQQGPLVLRLTFAIDSIGSEVALYSFRDPILSLDVQDKEFSIQTEQLWF